MRSFLPNSTQPWNCLACFIGTSMLIIKTTFDSFLYTMVFFDAVFVCWRVSDLCSPQNNFNLLTNNQRWVGSLFAFYKREILSTLPTFSTFLLQMKVNHQAILFYYISIYCKWRRPKSRKYHYPWQWCLGRIITYLLDFCH